MLKTAKGFTLLELMIVVAIIGLLVMIAYPSYQTHVKKSRRTEAKTGLLALAQLQEEYRAENNGYADDAALLAQPEATKILAERTFYSFAVERPKSTVFTLRANPKEGSVQAEDTLCSVFSLTQTGKKTAVDQSGKDTTADCW